MKACKLYHSHSCLQQEIHDPVKAVRRILDFTWAMAKLKLLIHESLDNPKSKVTHYKQLLL